MIMQVGMADCNKADTRGDWSPLHAAVQTGMVNTIEMLDGREVSADPRDRQGMTPLMLACLLGEREVVQMLLDMGASMELKDNSGWKALTYAAYGGHLSIIELLLDQGIDKNDKDKRGMKAIDWAEFMRFKHPDRREFGCCESYLETYVPNLMGKAKARNKYR